MTMDSHFPADKSVLVIKVTDEYKDTAVFEIRHHEEDEHPSLYVTAENEVEIKGPDLVNLLTELARAFAIVQKA